MLPVGEIELKGFARPIPAYEIRSLKSRSRTTPNETALSISTNRCLQVTACPERFSPPPNVSRFRGSPKNGRRARAFP